MYILFICRGNEGRSRMAEAIFNKLSKKNRAFSRAMELYPPYRPMHEGLKASITVLSEIGIHCPTRDPRKCTKKDIENSGLVIVLLEKKWRRILPRYITNSPKTRYHAVRDSDERLKTFIDDHRRVRDTLVKIITRLVSEIG